MDLEAQKRAPIYEALERFRKKRVVPFDVPGHKRGRGNPELAPPYTVAEDENTIFLTPASFIHSRSVSVVSILLR